jgi:hypothetical protein
VVDLGVVGAAVLYKEYPVVLPLGSKRMLLEVGLSHRVLQLVLDEVEALVSVEEATAPVP